MMMPRSLTTLFLAAFCASPLCAGDAPLGFRLWPHSWTRTSECPCLGGTPDDYCRKTICITDIARCGGPDDYCRKSIPCLLCPPFSPYLRYLHEPCCGPGERR